MLTKAALLQGVVMSGIAIAILRWLTTSSFSEGSVHMVVVIVPVVAMFVAAAASGFATAAASRYRHGPRLLASVPGALLGPIALLATWFFGFDNFWGTAAALVGVVINLAPTFLILQRTS